MELKGYSLSMPSWVTHTTEVYLFDEGYKATLVFEIGGNTKGGSSIQSAICSVEDWEIERCNIKHGKAGFDVDGYADAIYLVNDEGDTLRLDRDEFESELAGMVIGAKIVKWEAEKR